MTGLSRERERDTLVTICGAVNALGSAIAPLIIFPLVNFKDIILKGGPSVSMGVPRPSGWMTGDNFDKMDVA